ncbi:BON domain-containing protein [Burkholderia anthina]|uniref:BON domain-containing protein n=1 Tax=Burkholderia anthina TaxID=179879 RepID=UPI00158AB828|nr:BON domain-containing protein [Burkholderia anthina]
MARHKTYPLAPLDRELAERIEYELHHDPLAGKESIDVDVSGARATLSGHVATYAAKLAAAKAARQIPGVIAVTADLEIVPAASTRCTDAQLRDVALETLKWKAYLRTDTFEVSVRDGCVTLDGRVDWTYQKQLAERTLAALPGVTSIRNCLHVGDKQTQMEVMTAIRAALRNAAEAQADALDVHVCDGTVTLRGTLSAVEAGSLISEAARNHPEVRVVRNELQVIAAEAAEDARRKGGEAGRIPDDDAADGPGP